MQSTDVLEDRTVDWKSSSTDRISSSDSLHPATIRSQHMHYCVLILGRPTDLAYRSANRTANPPMMVAAQPRRFLRLRLVSSERSGVVVYLPCSVILGDFGDLQGNSCRSGACTAFKHVSSRPYVCFTLTFNVQNSKCMQQHLIGAP